MHTYFKFASTNTSTGNANKLNGTKGFHRNGRNNYYQKKWLINRSTNYNLLLLMLMDLVTWTKVCSTGILHSVFYYFVASN